LEISFSLFGCHQFIPMSFHVIGRISYWPKQRNFNNMQIGYR
jgi:hypothetical protein